MAKAVKKKEPVKRDKYEDKTPINASFMDIIKASVKDAKRKDVKKP